jgi:hypothetical protein
MPETKTSTAVHGIRESSINDGLTEGNEGEKVIGIAKWFVSSDFGQRDYN